MDKTLGKKIHRLSIYFLNYLEIKKYMIIILVHQFYNNKNFKIIQIFYCYAYCNPEILLTELPFPQKYFKGILASFSNSNQPPISWNRKIKR